MPLTRHDRIFRVKEGSVFGISDAHHFRKMVAGFCMLFAPICLLIGFIVDPDASYAFLFVGAILMVPAALGLMHMLREREVAFGHLGGGLSLIGLMGTAGLVGMDVGGATDLVDRVDHLTGVGNWMFVATMGFGLGMAMLGMGAFRAHAVQSWAAACLIVGGVAFDVALLAGSGGIAIAGAAIMLAGLGTTGYVVWRESDDAWEHTPALGAG
jgi:hypothetical protein